MSIKFTNFNSVDVIILPKEKINKIALNSKGNLLAGAGDSGTIFVWDIENKYSETTYSYDRTSVTAIVFSPNGNSIIVGNEDGLVRIVPLNDGSSSRLLSGHLAHIEEIVFNHKGTFLVTTSRDKTVRLWNWNKLNDQPIKLDDHKDWVWSAAFSPNDEQLMVGVHSNSEKTNETIHVWPTNIEAMSNLLCKYIDKNMTTNEWITYVAEDLPFENTCILNTSKK